MKVPQNEDGGPVQEAAAAIVASKQDPTQDSRSAPEAVPALDGESERLTTAEKFEQFHEQNPVVYEVLCRLAREWIDRTGRHELAIATLVETARWELAFKTSDPDYKINNVFRAYYARLIMQQEADLIGLFELRKSAADEWIGRAA